MIYVFIKQDISTMKQKFSKASLLLASVLSISFTATSQLYVKNRPSIPVIIRIPQPSPNHIWIDEEWDHNHDVYRYAGGHWELPQSVGDSWRHGLGNILSVVMFGFMDIGIMDLGKSKNINS